MKSSKFRFRTMMNRQIPIIAATTLVFAVAFTSCKDKDVTVTGVTVTPDRVTLDPGGTQQLTATVQPADATNQRVTWSSNNPDRATVSATGLVTIPASATLGEAVITVKTDDGGKIALCTVTVASYLISASTLNTFGVALAGYAERPLAQTVTVTNNGTGEIILAQPAPQHYDVGALSTSIIAPQATATFSVQPKANLPEGNYDETIVISGTGGASASVSATFSVSASAVYGISVTEEMLSFGSLSSPYTQPAAQTVTVNNIGNSVVTLVQPADADYYVIGTLSSTTLAAGTTVTFTVRPKTNLPIGKYEEIINIIGNDDVSASVTATFEVTPFSGDGSENNPYLIGTAAQMAALAELINNAATTANYDNKSYKLTGNITLSGEWTPIGGHGGGLYPYFKGVFDGAGFTISGLFIDLTGTGGDEPFMWQGLFGIVSDNAIVKNLGVIVDITTEAIYVGGVAGQVGSYATISNCYVAGSLSGAGSVGGIAGYSNRGLVSNCYTMVEITSIGTGNGGIVGTAINEYSVSNCYATGVITGPRLTGGIVGSSSASGSVTGCVALNPYFNYNGAQDVNIARVVGNGLGALTNNAGLDIMVCNGGGTLQSAGAGDDITVVQAKTQSAYTDREWKFGANEANPWKMITNGLPNLYWQATAPELPEHLK